MQLRRYVCIALFLYFVIYVAKSSFAISFFMYIYIYICLSLCQNLFLSLFVVNFYM